jgi:eukaryotic-like serine/threonine-protein kinase
VNAPIEIASYRIERLLGIGSFATVWLGFDPTLGARVAIKVLAENWSHDLRVRERFLDEARLLWRLDHERLVRVHALGELSDGRPYLVMAWAQGGSLRDRLAAGPLPIREAVSVLREIAEGAAVLHGRGIVHRDLTPGNVLFEGPSVEPSSEGCAAGRVMIADLGLAKSLAAASGLTARAGTPGFMAPEQDDPLAMVDARSDVFGLGRLGVLLLGLRTVRSGMPVPLRFGVPQRIGAVLSKATAFRAVDRYPDAAAFRAALDRAIGGWLPSRGVSRFRTARERRRITVSAALLAVAIGLTMTASASVPPRSPGEWATGFDATGRIMVALPDGWRVKGSNWRGPDGRLEPALVMAPDPDRWGTDPVMPGAFVGLVTRTSTPDTAATFIAGRREQRNCIASPVRITRPSGADWIVAESTSCRSGRPVVIDAAMVGPGGTSLVYVQVTPPAGRGPDFVDTLLGGVGVRR